MQRLNPKQAFLHYDVLLSLLVALFLFLRYFRLPFVPIDPLVGDQAIFLDDAVRMLQGEVIYRDFSQFNLPGTECFYYVLVRAFGQVASISALTGVFVGFLYFLLGIALSRRVLSGWTVYVGSLFFMAFAYIPILSPTHHVFSALLILGALLALIRGQEQESGARGYAWAGILCAIAVMFSSSRALSVAFFGVAFAIETKTTKRQLASFGAAFALTLAVCFVPLLLIVGPTILWKELAEFLLLHYRAWPGNNLTGFALDLPSITGPRVLDVAQQSLALFKWMALYLSCPGAYILAAVVIPRKAKSYAESRQLWMICLTGVGLFLSVATTPFIFRLAAVALPSSIMLAWYLKESGKAGVAVAGFLGLLSVILIPLGIARSQSHQYPLVNTPSGPVIVKAAPDSTYERYAWIGSHTSPGDYFYSSVNADDYYLFHLKNPSPVQFITIYSYTTAEQVSATVSGIRKNKVRFVLWGREIRTEALATDPGPAGEDNLEPLRQMLRSEYHVAYVFQNSDQIWERN